MPVDIIRIEGNIGHDRNIGDGLFNGGNRAIGQVFRVPRLGAVLGFKRGICIREQADRGNAKRLGLLRSFDHQIKRQTIDPGHGGDRFANPFAIAQKHGPNEIIDA